MEKEEENKKKANCINGLSEDQLAVAFRNIGYDITCGNCACLFFTGYGGYGCDPGCTTGR
jgi:hypothetical protein